MASACLIRRSFKFLIGRTIARPRDIVLEDTNTKLPTSCFAFVYCSFDIDWRIELASTDSGVIVALAGSESPGQALQCPSLDAWQSCAIFCSFSLYPCPSSALALAGKIPGVYGGCHNVLGS